MTPDEDIIDMDSPEYACLDYCIHLEHIVCQVFRLHPLLAAHEKLAPLESSWIAFPDTQRPMPHFVKISNLIKGQDWKTRRTKQAPIPTMTRLTTVRTIFFQEAPYWPRFRNNQKIPLRPSYMEVSIINGMV
jgi:hypothetical protein